MKCRSSAVSPIPLFSPNIPVFHWPWLLFSAVHRPREYFEFRLRRTPLNSPYPAPGTSTVPDFYKDVSTKDYTSSWSHAPFVLFLIGYCYVDLVSVEVTTSHLPLPGARHINSTKFLQIRLHLTVPFVLLLLIGHCYVDLVSVEVKPLNYPYPAPGTSTPLVWVPSFCKSVFTLPPESRSLCIFASDRPIQRWFSF